MDSQRIYKARKYRFNNGVSYRQNLYQLHWVEEDGFVTKAIMGGMVVLGDKVLAYVGSPISIREKVSDIINSGHTKHHVWADSIEEALRKIRPYLDATAI